MSFTLESIRRFLPGARREPVPKQDSLKPSPEVPADTFLESLSSADRDNVLLIRGFVQSLRGEFQGTRFGLIAKDLDERDSINLSVLVSRTQLDDTSGFMRALKASCKDFFSGQESVRSLRQLWHGLNVEFYGKGQTVYFDIWNPDRFELDSGIYGLRNKGEQFSLLWRDRFPPRAKPLSQEAA